MSAVPAFDNGVVQLYQGDARRVLRNLSAESVHCVVTSPPYWGLRDYGLEPLVWGGDDHEHEWGEWVESHDERESTEHGKTRTTTRFYGDESRRFNGNHQKHTSGAFCPCGTWRGSLGLEPTIDLYVQHIVEVLREVWRVLRKDGTAWLNMGDSYSGSGKGQMGNGQHSQEHGTKQGTNPGTLVGGLPTAYSLKAKDLCMMPARVALALQADGWWLRSDIVWSKPNPMPESVADRPTRAHEMLFLLAKAERYFYDADAIREPSNGQHGGPFGSYPEGTFRRDAARPRPEDSGHRNKRSVWEIATEPLSGDVVHGRHRTVSPDCPVHGYQVGHVDVAPDDEQQDASQSGRSPHTDNRLAQELGGAVPSKPESQDGGLVDASAATDRNRQTHRMDAGLEQDDSCGEAEFSRTEYSESPQRSDTVASDIESSRTEVDFFSDGKETGREEQTPSDNSHTLQPEWTFESTPDNCSCHYTGKVAKKIDHFASFPQKLVEPCILAGTSGKGVCPECGAPWERVVETPSYGDWHGRKGTEDELGKGQVGKPIPHDYYRTTTGWRPSCDCGSENTVPATVLDPFAGSGTVAYVAQRLGRRAIGIDLSAEYLALAAKRLDGLTLPMDLA